MVTVTSSKVFLADKTACALDDGRHLTSYVTEMQLIF